MPVEKLLFWLSVSNTEILNCKSIIIEQLCFVACEAPFQSSRLSALSSPPAALIWTKQKPSTLYCRNVWTTWGDPPCLLSICTCSQPLPASHRICWRHSLSFPLVINNSSSSSSSRLGEGVFCGRLLRGGALPWDSTLHLVLCLLHMPSWNHLLVKRMTRNIS